MRHCCKNCHFLVKEHRDPTGGIYRFSWNKRERSDLRVDEQYAANCFQGIWDTGVDPSLNKRLPEILNKQRRDDCFFIEPQEGMLFAAALELHKIRNLKKSYLYTQIGLWIAAIGLVLNLLYSILKDLFLNP